MKPATIHAIAKLYRGEGLTQADVYAVAATLTAGDTSDLIALQLLREIVERLASRIAEMLPGCVSALAAYKIIEREAEK